MQQVDFVTIMAVFQEMLGGWLWVLLAIIVFGTLAFIALLMLEKGLIASRMIKSQAAGLVGGVVALFIMTLVSSSGFTDAGGPADWFLIAIVYGLGFVGSAIILYTLVGWIHALKVAK